MLSTLISGQIDKLERLWGYDASYLRMVLRANPMSALKFGMVSQMADQKAAPAEVIAAAKIVGTLAEDCGPCTQIAIDMAAADGVARYPACDPGRGRGGDGRGRRAWLAFRLRQPGSGPGGG